MTGPATSRPAVLLREGALWGTAALVVLGAHLGGALWLMHRAEAAAPPGISEPVFVELAPMPTAAAPLDEAETPEITEAAPEPTPEPPPEPEPEPLPEVALEQPLPELEPVPDMSSLFPPPPEAVVLQKSDRPKDRPEPKEPEPVAKVVKKQPEQKKKDKAPEVQEAREASTTVRAQKADRSAAPAQGAQVSPRQEASWQSKLQSAVGRHMNRTRIPGARGGDVRVTVAFTVTGSGGVTGARLVGTTGDSNRDAALSRQVSRLTRLPPHPSGQNVPITLPVLIQQR